jgi:hypothetical protein
MEENLDSAFTRQRVTAMVNVIQHMLRQQNLPSLPFQVTETTQMKNVYQITLMLSEAQHERVEKSIIFLKSLKLLVLSSFPVFPFYFSLSKCCSSTEKVFYIVPTTILTELGLLKKTVLTMAQGIRNNSYFFLRDLPLDITKKILGFAFDFVKESTPLGFELMTQYLQGVPRILSPPPPSCINRFCSFFRSKIPLLLPVSLLPAPEISSVSSEENASTSGSFKN